MKLSKNDEQLTIYWSPCYDDEKEDWNMLYSEPDNLFLDLIKKKEELSQRESLFSCPAVSSRLKNSFIFRNALDTKFSYDFSDKYSPSVNFDHGVFASYFKPSSIIGGASVRLSLNWIFFAEESVQLLINPTMFHKTNLSQHGFVVPGRYDASKWFRPLSGEIQMWDSKGEVLIKEDDPMFYIEVLTDKKVILQRFAMNDKLIKYKNACVKAPYIHGNNLPLKYRYNKFLKTRTDELVLNEIKKNLL